MSRLSCLVAPLSTAGLLLAPASQAACLAENFEAGLGARWKEKVFEGRTTYSLVDRDGSKVLQAISASACSALGAEISCPIPKGSTVSWRWNASSLPPGAGVKKLFNFDHTLRVTLLFKTAIGTPRSINYVWSTSQPLGSTYPHPSSGRTRFIVLRSGQANLGLWIEEKRDIAADWRLLFDDSELPDLVGIAVMTDSDGTFSTVVGYYDDLLIQ